MMDQAGVRRPDITQACLLRTQAQIYVVAYNRQLLIKTTEFLEALASQHQAGTSAGRNIPHTTIQFQIDAFARQLFVEQVARSAAVINEEYTCVLYRAVRIQQQAADRANGVAQRLFNHGFQPVWLDGFDIVVQEQQLLAMAVLHSYVVQA